MSEEFMELTCDIPFHKGQIYGYKQGWHEGLELGYFFAINRFMKEENLSFEQACERLHINEGICEIDNGGQERYEERIRDFVKEFEKLMNGIFRADFVKAHELMRGFWADGLNKGLELGLSEGFDQACADIIKTCMVNENMSFEQACERLHIGENKDIKEKYRDFLGIERESLYYYREISKIERITERYEYWTKKPREDVFRVLMEKCRNFIIPIINDMYYTDYSIDEDVHVFADEQLFEYENGEKCMKITDIYVGITDRFYHLECERDEDGYIKIRPAKS